MNKKYNFAHIKPLGPLTEFFITLYKVYLGICIALAPLLCYFLASLPKYKSRANIMNDMGAPLVVLFITLGAFFVFGILLLITKIRWIYRSNRNLRIMSDMTPSFSPEAIILIFIVPFIVYIIFALTPLKEFVSFAFSLFFCIMPYYLLKDIWRVARRGAKNDGSILGWWLLAELAGVILGIFTPHSFTNMEDLRQNLNSYLIGITLSGAFMVTAVLLHIKIIRKIYQSYRENYDEMIKGYRDETKSPNEKENMICPPKIGFNRPQNENESRPTSTKQDLSKDKPKSPRPAQAAHSEPAPTQAPKTPKADPNKSFNDQLIRRANLQKPKSGVK